MDAMIQFLMDATMKNYKSYRDGLGAKDLEAFDYGTAYGLTLASKQLTITADSIGIDSDDLRAELLVDEIEKLTQKVEAL